eukprot:scaffold65604_cov52-Phaeocystis_antarctica.AAC.1
MVRALGQFLLRELEKVVSRSLALGHVVGHVRVHVHKRDSAGRCQMHPAGPQLPARWWAGTGVADRT